MTKVKLFFHLVFVVLLLIGVLFVNISSAETEKAHIVTVKNAITNAAQDFSFQNNFGNGNPETFLLDDDSNNTLPDTRDFEVLPGTYSISEDPVAGWKQGSQTCTGNGNTPSNITVGAGETVTCTFVNNKLATIVLVKNTIGGDGVFDFVMTGETLPASAQLTTIGNIATQTFNNIDPDNTYSITEIVLSDWNLTSSSCTGTNTPESITPNNGETVTCDFNNTKRGSITVNKNVVNNDGGIKTADDFSFKINDGDAIAFETDGQNSVIVEPGVYSVIEIEDSGYTVTYDNCANINVTAGDEAICAITNDDIPAPIIIEETTAATTPVSAPDPVPALNRGRGLPVNLTTTGQVLGASIEIPPIVEVPKDSIETPSETPPTATGKILGAEKFVFTFFLKKGPPYKVKTKGNEVTELQKLLADLELYKGSIDGKFGPVTETAVKAFQKANPPLETDGVVGEETRTILNNRELRK